MHICIALGSGLLATEAGGYSLAVLFEGFSRRVKLAEKARWSKEKRAGDGDAEQDMPGGPSSPECWFLLRQIGKVKLVEHTSLKHRS